MKVGIVGAGTLGRAMARRLRDAGHEVLFGGSDAAEEAASDLGVAWASNSAAAAFGQVVALAVPFTAVAAAVGESGPLDGVVLWSCVNAVKPDLSGLVVGFDTSAAEEVAKLAPRARVVSAIPPFADALRNHDLLYDNGLNPSVFVCGDDDSANALVGQLVADLGAQPVQAGPLAAARLVEPAMMLLVGIAYAGLPRDVGLRLLERTH
jgi:8-hydroxy-5-deazaflavin:NADPH oxidoreductase